MKKHITFLVLKKQDHYARALVDPSSDNFRAMQVYEKAGFVKLIQQPNAAFVLMGKKLR